MLLGLTYQLIRFIADLVLVGSLCGQETRRRVRDLGVPSGGIASAAAALNSTPVVAGYLTLASPNRPVAHAAWSNGQRTDYSSLFTQLGVRSSTLSGVNASGTVAGTFTDGGPQNAFVLAGTTLTVLNGMFQATGISSGGAVVGWTPGACPHAALWSGCQQTDLGTLGGCFSFGEAVNDVSQVTGQAATPTSNHAFLWQQGAMTDIGTLGGCTATGRAINQDGVVVGDSDVGGSSESCAGRTHAFLWASGAMTDLGVLPGFVASSAAGVNRALTVVGQDTGFGGTQTAFVRRTDGMHDLNTLVDGSFGWYLGAANGGQRERPDRRGRHPLRPGAGLPAHPLRVAVAQSTLCRQLPRGGPVPDRRHADRNRRIDARPVKRPLLDAATAPPRRQAGMATEVATASPTCRAGELRALFRGFPGVGRLPDCRRGRDEHRRPGRAGWIARLPGTRDARQH